jgi:hemoglobin
MREKQLLIDFLCTSAGGPTYYRGRDMLLCHRGMRISESDWTVFLGYWQRPDTPGTGRTGYPNL